MTRKYEQRARATKQDETRERIARAARELHGIVGPSRTTVSAIAERAGVQRNTFYRHFPDDRSLLLACSAQHLREQPMPTPDAWADIDDPRERSRRALRALFAWYADNESTTRLVLRDAATDEVLRDVVALRLGTPLAAIAESLVDVWPDSRTNRLRAAAAHVAMSFATWEGLVRDSALSTDEAADLATEMIAAASDELARAALRPSG